MAYRRTGRRRNFGRRRRRTSRLRNIKRKTGARSQSRQIASLERRVNRIAKESSQYAQFEILPEGAGQGTGVNLNTGDFYVSCLTRPANWKPIFQAAALTGATTGNTVNKCKMTSADLQFVFSPQDSLEALTPRIVNVWLLKLRKETAMDVLSETGNMSSAGLTTANNDVVHKSTVAGGAFTMIKWNPASFHVLQHRQFTLANIIQETAVPGEDDTVTNTYDALKRVRMIPKMGNELKVPKGSVLELNELDTMPNDRYYVVVHVGGWTGGAGLVNGVRMDTNWCINTRMYI